MPYLSHFKEENVERIEEGREGEMSKQDKLYSLFLEKKISLFGRQNYRERGEKALLSAGSLPKLLQWPGPGQSQEPESPSASPT